MPDWDMHGRCAGILNHPNDSSFDSIRPDKPLKTFKRPTQIAFLLFGFLLTFSSAFDPLGLWGFPAAAMSGAMMVMLGLSLAESTPPKRWMFGLIPTVTVLLPYFAFLLITHSPTAALMTILPLALAAPIFLTLRMNAGRSVSIAAAALAAAVLWVLSFALILFEGGELSGETVRAVLDEMFVPVEKMLASVTYEKDGQTVSYYSEEDIALLIYRFQTLMIGALGTVMIALAYLCTVFCCVIARCFGVEALLPQSLYIRLRRKKDGDGIEEDSREALLWQIRISNLTAGIFTVLYLLSVFIGAVQSPLAIALQNLMLLLTPAFLYTGARRIGRNLRGRSDAGPRLGCFPIGLGALLLIVNPPAAMMLLLVVGVTSVFRENFQYTEIRHGSGDSK